MSTKFDYDGLSKRMTERIGNIKTCLVIRKIFELINSESLNVSLFIFGGMPRDMISGERNGDIDICVVGDPGERNWVKRMIEKKFKGSIQRNGNYFGNGQSDNIFDVVEFKSDYISFDFVFAQDIPELLDFDINGMYVFLDDQKTNYTWKDIRVGSVGRSSNQKLKKMIQQIVEKKCIPTPYILGQSDGGKNELRCAIHHLYRFAKMLDKGYDIQGEWQTYYMKKYNVIKEAEYWYETVWKPIHKKIIESRGFGGYDEMTVADNTKRDILDQSFTKISLIKRALKKFCLNRIASVSISLIPLDLPVYVQLWILEFELPIGDCIGEFERVQCLDNVRQSRIEVMNRRVNPRHSIPRFYRKYESDDDDDY